MDLKTKVKQGFHRANILQDVIIKQLAHVCTVFYLPEFTFKQVKYCKDKEDFLQNKRNKTLSILYINKIGHRIMCKLFFFFRILDIVENKHSFF